MKLNKPLKALVLTALFGIVFGTTVAGAALENDVLGTKDMLQVEVQHSIIIYTMDGCGYCHQVLEYLKDKGIVFVERNISHSKENRAAMEALGGGSGVPQATIDGKFYQGASDILNALEGL